MFLNLQMWDLFFCTCEVLNRSGELRNGGFYPDRIKPHGGQALRQNR